MFLKNVHGFFLFWWGEGSWGVLLFVTNYMYNTGTRSYKQMNGQLKSKNKQKNQCQKDCPGFGWLVL